MRSFLSCFPELTVLDFSFWISVDVLCSLDIFFAPAPNFEHAGNRSVTRGSSVLTALGASFVSLPFVELC